jgi:hypothetical protein
VGIHHTSSPNPELHFISLNTETLTSFCRLKHAIHLLGKSPPELQIELQKLFKQFDSIEGSPIITLSQNTAEPTVNTDTPESKRKSGREVYYLSEAGEDLPTKINTSKLWNLKGFGLPESSRNPGNLSEKNKLLVENEQEALAFANLLKKKDRRSSSLFFGIGLMMLSAILIMVSNLYFNSAIISGFCISFWILGLSLVTVSGNINATSIERTDALFKPLTLMILLLLLVDVVLGFYGQTDLGLYYSANAISFLILALIYRAYHMTTKASLNIVGGVLFLGYSVVILLKLAQLID